jgi:hypothetical protein
MSSSKGNVLLHMDVKGATKESIEHVQAKLPSVKFVSFDENNGVQNIQFEYGKEKDPREDLFKYAVKNKWTILKMNPHTTNLEDIFRDLTMEDNANA